MKIEYIKRGYFFNGKLYQRTSKRSVAKKRRLHRVNLERVKVCEPIKPINIPRKDIIGDDIKLMSFR